MKKILIFSLIISIFSSSCISIKYSFTGASISADIKTINIQYFANNAALIEPTLSPKLPEAIKDKFTSETNLNLSEQEADLYLQGEVIDYKTTPQAIQNNDQAAMNRLSVTIKVEYTNTKDEKKNYQTTFERYIDYPSSQELDAVKDKLLDEIIELLIQDIFNKAVINW
jgi:hypothetical protein